MSATEDCELHDLVKQTLEKTGSLSKIRAELRAGIFMALEENGCFQGTNSKNPELQNFTQNADGALVLCLMREFLEYFGLSFTMSVLDPELASYKVHCSWKSRSDLMKQLNLPSDFDREQKKPLIYHILQQFRCQQNIVPNPLSKFSKNQKEITRLTEYMASHSSSGCPDPPNKTFRSKDVPYSESDEKIEQLGTGPSNILSTTDNVEMEENAKLSNMSVKDTLNNDLYKPNLSFLGDLPPLSPTTSTGKINPSASNKASKQMSKLKAMLIEPNQENTNASNFTDDELANSIDNDDISDLDNFDENQIQELLKD